MPPKPLNREEILENAEKALKEPFFSKTITGFVRSDAWKTVITGVTLRTKEDKAQFRDRNALNNKPYRVRLNPTTSRLETHDARDKNQSLHIIEKLRRKEKGLTPLPPHQSFTYYDPEDSNFVPSYFSPWLSTQNETIGIRASTEKAHINRLIFKDAGTFTVFYGFSTIDEASNYLRKIVHNKEWAYNLKDLKTKSKTYSYNEAMVRINWHCDGTSQLVLYPRLVSVFDLAGRYAAMLYRYDLENHLRNNQSIYKKEPFYWTEDYYVPISFWGNKSPEQFECWGSGVFNALTTLNPLHLMAIKPHLYTLEEQENDLTKEATNLRESILKAAIYYMKAEGFFPIDVMQEFNQHLSTATPTELISACKFLDWISKTHHGFIQKLFCLTMNQVNWYKMKEYTQSNHPALYSTLFLPDTISNLTEKEQHIILTQVVMPRNAIMLTQSINNGNTKMVAKQLTFASHQKRNNTPAFVQANNMILKQCTFNQKLNLFLNAIKSRPSDVDDLLEFIKTDYEDNQFGILEKAYLFAIKSKSAAIEPLINRILELKTDQVKNIAKKMRPLHALKKMEHTHKDAKHFITAELSLLLNELKTLVDKYDTQSKKKPFDKTLQLVSSETKKLHDELTQSVNRYKLSKETNKIEHLIADFSLISQKRHPAIKKYPDILEYFIKILAMLTIVYAIYLLIKAPKQYKENKSLFFQSPTEKKLDEFIDLTTYLKPL